MSRRDREQSVRIALGGMLGAGSLVILWLACIVPSGWLGLTAVAGLFPVTATLYAGRAAGYMCWAAGSLLGLVLLPNKGIPLLYLVFLGLYPVVKSRIEGLRRGAVEWLLKLIFFNAALIASKEMIVTSLPGVFPAAFNASIAPNAMLSFCATTTSMSLFCFKKDSITS